MITFPWEADLKKPIVVPPTPNIFKWGADTDKDFNKPQTLGEVVITAKAKKKKPTFNYWLLLLPLFVLIIFIILIRRK